MRTLEINIEDVKQHNQLLAFLKKLNIKYIIKDSNGFSAQIFAEKEVANTYNNAVTGLVSDSDRLQNDDEETPITGKMIGALASKSVSFNFLNADEEDIYSEADLKIKY